MTKEKYYAIRIGKPGKHYPYFMIQKVGGVPALFQTRAKALAYLPPSTKVSYCKVVRVWVHDKP